MVAEMRPFLLDEITGVKKYSHKPIILLNFIFSLGRIPLLCDRFVLTNKKEKPRRRQPSGPTKTSARMFS